MDNLRIYKEIFTGSWNEAESDIHDLLSDINKCYEFKILKYNRESKICIYLYDNMGNTSFPKYTIINPDLTAEELEHKFRKYLRTYTINKLLDNNI